jgi:GTP-binding protein
MNNNLRNVAIIAHVDHGKTTLVDQMFRQSGLFRESESVSERLMDSMALERERGITIAAKNCAVEWNQTKINILDTPGHADFGGEVERALMMVDGALLLVDAAEGPLPQTRFVLSKTLALKLPVIVLVNKIDRKDARPKEVLNEVYDLFIDLDANDEQLEFPVLYTVGRDGTASFTMEKQEADLSPLFKTIIEKIPAPSCPVDDPFQMLVLDLGYSDYLGRLATGKVVAGRAKKADALVRIGRDGEPQRLKVAELQGYRGPSLAPTEEAVAGDIVVLAGAADVEIGDTIAKPETPVALPRVEIDPPTISMRFTQNTSPFSGQEGKYVQMPRIKERLERELLYNVSLQIEPASDNDGFIVKGRGELQLAILIETMRREGFELSIGRPQVIVQKREDSDYEPVEHLVIDCDESHVGLITERLAKRKGRMVNLKVSGERARVEFSIPARGLIGYRSQFLTDTRGTGIMNSYLDGWEPYKGDFTARSTGSLVSDREGVAIAYALFNLEPRGQLFIIPGARVYEGMVIGEHNRDRDLNVNPTKAKKLTNVRAAGKDENVVLTPITPLSLEAALEFIGDDELVEVTPESIRLRKKELRANFRKSA